MIYFKSISLYAYNKYGVLWGTKLFPIETYNHKLFNQTLNVSLFLFSSIENFEIFGCFLNRM